MNHLPFHHFKNQHKGGLMVPYNHQVKHIMDRYFPGRRRFEVGSHLIFE